MSADSTGTKTPYLLAVRRESKQDVPDNWIELVKELPGVDVDESVSKRRVLIHTDPDALKSVIDRFGQYCYVEPIIRFHKSQKAAAQSPNFLDQRASEKEDPSEKK